MRGRVIVVPGLAAGTYAVEPVERLRPVGYDAELRPRLSWNDVPVNIADYGRALGAEISAAGEPVDVLVGLAAGSQAAAGCRQRTCRRGGNTDEDCVRPLSKPG